MASLHDTRQLLLPYTLGLVALCAILQVIVAIRGPKVDIIDGLLFVPVAIYYAAFERIRRRSLTRIRFGALVAHAVTFAVVNGSWQLHAFFAAAPLNDNSVALDPSWIGPTFAMCGFWSIGLTLHAISAISQRGFESRS